MAFTGPDPISSCGCSCSSATKVSEPALFLAGRGCDGVETCSDDGVRYSNGELQYAVRALSASWWSHTLVYSNRLNEDKDFGNGVNWMVKEWWQLFNLTATNELLILRGSQSALWFSTPGLEPKYGALHQLVEDSGYYVLVCPNGIATMFYGFSYGTVNLRGKMVSQITPGGQERVFTYNGNGDVIEVQMSFPTGFVTTIEKFVYTYSNGRVATITLQRKVGAGSFVDLRRVRFEYYTSNGLHGRVGDLKKVVTQFLCPVSSSSSSSSGSSGEWADHDVHYFRYYTGASSSSSSSSSSGSNQPYDFAHGLKFAVGPQGCERIGPTIDSESDGTIAANADHYVEYDTDRHVIRNVIASDGFEYTYDYLASSFGSPDTNTWIMRTTRRAPDGAYTRIYANDAGQVMLQQFSSGNPDSSPGSRWIEYQQFDADYHLTLRVSPSGIDMGAGTIFDPAEPDLAVALRETEGLFHVWEYGDGMFAPAGYLTGTWIAKGTDDLDVPTAIRILAYNNGQEREITAYDNDFTLAVLVSETVYRGDNSDPIITNYTYTWHDVTAGVETRVIQLPTVPTDQNGTGSDVFRREMYDVFGNLTILQDERRYYGTWTYDLPTRAVLQAVQDSSKPASAPGGWPSPPVGTRLALTTDNVIDDEGRVTQSLGPIHEVDFGGAATEIRSAAWNVYRDHCDTTYDETWSAQGFMIVDGEQKYLVNPVSISRAARTGLSSDRIVATRGATAVSPGELTDANSFPLSTWVRLSHEDYNYQGQLTTSRLYHRIPTTLPGSAGTNYNDTKYIYDPATGRQFGVMTPRGTITRSVYDVRGLLVQTQVGTNDFGFSSVNFITGAGPENLEIISANIYDSGSDGRNGNLTTATAYADASDTRGTDYDYDFRNRQEMATHNDGTYLTYTKPTYDNLNQVVMVERYQVPDAGPDILIAQGETSFDDMGRVYESRRYSVEGGIPGDYLRDRTWHDDAGNVIKTIGSSSEAFTKTFYDAVGRTIRTQLGYEVPNSSSSSSSPSSLDKIFVQTDTRYDKASNVIETVSLARYHDFTGTGDLFANSNARPTYTAYYSEHYPEYSPNVFGCESAVAQYGTNDEEPFERSPTVPGRSDIVLVNSTKYNSRGEAEEQTDPRGIVAREEFDHAGRRETRIENYVSASSSSSSSTCWTDDQNVTTTWTYNASGAVETVTVHNASTGNQTTEYHYGVTVSGGSKLESDDILHQITFPGNATHAFLEYNRQGEKIKSTDQNETVHEFSYDKSGRLTVDEVTEFGDGVDETIFKIVTEYDERGRVLSVTDWYPPDDLDPESVHSQILNVYNGLDMMVRQYQEHIGAVTETSLHVDFNFDMTVVGDDYSKGVRPTSIVYPSGRYVHYDYGVAGGDGDKLSRIAEIKDDDNSTVLAAYDYLGANRVVIEDYVQPQVKLDYTTSTCTPSSSSSSAAMKYPGFDRFNRVVQHQWCSYGSSPGIVDRFDYTYDRDGNPLTKKSYACTNTSELRTFDGLNRLKTYKRGALSSGSIPSPVRQEDFSLDPTANWKCYDVRESGTLTLAQQQTHNALNEITGITESGGQPQWPTPAYDNNGNMTQCPQPVAMTSSYNLSFDAWNRLVQVSNTGGATVATYRYDGVNRRITKLAHSESVLSYYFYGTSSSIPIEERRGPGTSLLLPSDYWQQRILGLSGCFAMYDCNPAALPSVWSSSSSSSTIDQPTRFFELADANLVTSSLVTPSGTAVERYLTNAAGTRVVLNAECMPVVTNTQYDNWYIGRDICLDETTRIQRTGLIDYHPSIGQPINDVPFIIPLGQIPLFPNTSPIPTLPLPKNDYIPDPGFGYVPPLELPGYGVTGPFNPTPPPTSPPAPIIIPGPPSGSPGKSCGLDTTWFFEKLDEEIEKRMAEDRFRSREDKDKLRKRCESITSITKAGNAWDVSEMARMGTRFMGSSFIGDGCGEGVCEGTLQIRDKCYRAAEANYFWLGIIMRRCEALFPGEGWRQDTRSCIPLYRRLWPGFYRGTDLPNERDSPRNGILGRIAFFDAGYVKGTFYIPGAVVHRCGHCPTKYKAALNPTWGGDPGNRETIEISP